MTKSQLVEQIVRRAPHLPRRVVEAVVSSIFDSMTDTLRSGGRVEIRGFGSFSVRERRPREGRNPKTGIRVVVPRRRLPAFTVGKELRERLNPRLVQQQHASVELEDAGQSPP